MTSFVGAQALLDFITEREAIRVKKERGDPAPWTNEPILREWSFCNVHREHDRVTRWIAANWREPNAGDPDLWFTMVIARFVNWPDTLAELGYPVPWRPEHFLSVMAGRKARGEKCYGNAYMIRADRQHTDKATYQVEQVFDPLWRARNRPRPKQGDCLAEYFGTLTQFHGMGGGFMPAQIVADLKYVAPLTDANDWWDWAASGPGSRRGMYRLLGRPLPNDKQNAPWRGGEYDWLTKLRELQEQITPELERIGVGRLHAQDLQNCLCEFDKVERVRLGEGTPKRRYRLNISPVPAAVRPAATVAAVCGPANVPEPPVKPASDRPTMSDISFPVTIFKDWYAVEKTECTVTCTEFVEMVSGASASHKDDLPWLKLATFGDTKTDDGCLRNNANVLQVFGAECDYDDGIVSFDEAVERAREAGVLTILYTSPSYTPEKPRWRAIHPFAGPMLPAGRADMTDRANAIFGGVLKPESWVLSQSYYYGRINGHFRIELVEGDPIDTRHDICGIGKPGGVVEHTYGEGTPISVEQFRAAGAAVALAAAELPYPKLMPLIAATARVNVIGDDDRAVREEVARAIRAATPNSHMDEKRFLNAFNSPIRVGQRTASPATFFHYAHLGRWVPDPAKAAVTSEGVTLNDFHAYMPTHGYIYRPTRAMWPGASVNSRIPPVPLFKANGEPLLDDEGKPRKISATAWLDRHRPVEQMTWAPGLPMTIADRLILLEGGWIERRGVTCFNLYHPPTIEPGDPRKATRWIAHVRYVYPSDAEHIMDWLAHRVQKPAEKINHALVLGGEQGIGKDTLLEPVKYAVGPWNFQEASPIQVLGRFNGFLKAVVLRISEARDLGDFDRFQFYDHMKVYTAAPPDVLRVDEKYLREYPIANCCGVVITTNHKTDGIYLPADDRRHYVAWSDLTKDDERFQDGYWKDLWGWYEEGSVRHVTAYLLERDLNDFDAKAPPPKTAAFWEIADANRPPEEPELADALDVLKNPDAVTLEMLRDASRGDFSDWICDRKNRRIIPHRLEKSGYVPVRNPDATDGLWKNQSGRQVAYAKVAMTLSERIAAVTKLFRSQQVDIDYGIGSRGR